MSSITKHQIIAALATMAKIAGALSHAAAISPVVAFASLLAGSAISLAQAVATGNATRGQLVLEASFLSANVAGIARAVGLLG